MSAGTHWCVQSCLPIQLILQRRTEQLLIRHSSRGKSKNVWCKILGAFPPVLLLWTSQERSCPDQTLCKTQPKHSNVNSHSLLQMHEGIALEDENSRLQQQVAQLQDEVHRLDGTPPHMHSSPPHAPPPTPENASAVDVRAFAEAGCLLELSDNACLVLAAYDVSHPIISIPDREFCLRAMLGLLDGPLSPAPFLYLA